MATGTDEAGMFSGETKAGFAMVKGRGGESRNRHIPSQMFFMAFIAFSRCGLRVHSVFALQQESNFIVTTETLRCRNFSPAVMTLRAGGYPFEGLMAPG